MPADGVGAGSVPKARQLQQCRVVPVLAKGLLAKVGTNSPSWQWDQSLAEVVTAPNWVDTLLCAIA